MRFFLNVPAEADDVGRQFSASPEAFAELLAGAADYLDINDWRDELADGVAARISEETLTFLVAFTQRVEATWQRDREADHADL